MEIQIHATGKKSPKKSPGPLIPHRKKIQAFPALETGKQQSTIPGKDPGKKPRIKEEVRKEEKSPMGKKDPGQTSKNQRPSSDKSVRKAPHTPKQWPKNHKEL